MIVFKMEGLVFRVVQRLDSVKILNTSLIFVFLLLLFFRRKEDLMLQASLGKSSQF